MICFSSAHFPTGSRKRKIENEHQAVNLGTFSWIPSHLRLINYRQLTTDFAWFRQRGMQHRRVEGLVDLEKVLRIRVGIRQESDSLGISVARTKNEQFDPSSFRFNYFLSCHFSQDSKCWGKKSKWPNLDHESSFLFGRWMWKGKEGDGRDSLASHQDYME